MPVIFFFRNPTQQDPYELLFSEAGWQAHSIPVLRFEYAGKGAIQRCLVQPEVYSGIVFTSVRAVKAIKDRQIDIAVPWKDKPVYTVGPATSRSLASLGITPLGEEAGNAEELAHFILQHHRGRALPLLFMCGSSRRDELPAILSSNGIGVEECIVYDTHPVDVIELDVKPTPDVVAFFSPSGVQAVHNHWPEEWMKVGCVAIGERTAHALHEAGLDAIATAHAPTPEGLLDAIQKCTSVS